MSAQLRSDLAGPEATNIHVLKRIYVDLPLSSSHVGHIMGDVCSVFS